MTLGKIWSAFIIIAISIACYQLVAHKQTTIFSKMVIGKADDAVDTVYYTLMQNPVKAGFKDTASFVNYAKTFAYAPANAGHTAAIAIATTTSTSIEQLKARWIKPSDGIIETCKSAVQICLGLIGIMALFMGLMRIAEVAGGIQWLSKIIGPFFTKLFPEIPKGHPSIGHMMLNFSANLLGLDNAATPFGLKAMQSLQELNPNKETASNAQIMFLCLHASGLTLIPISIIATRAALKSANPTDIFVPCMLATFIATMAAMIIVSLRQKIKLLQPVILVWILGLSAIIAALVVYMLHLSQAGLSEFSSLLSNGIILFLFVAIIGGAWYKKVDVFDAFVEGAKGGFETSVKIIPYLVGMLVAISMLRTSGTFDLCVQGMKHVFASIGMDTHFVDGLPTALIKPMSGSGARGMMIDTMKNVGVDSFAGKLSCVLQGSSDTTLYVVAVYFGAVGIKKTRYAIGTMLLADLVGIISAILLCYLFFAKDLIA